MGLPENVDNFGEASDSLVRGVVDASERVVPPIRRLTTEHGLPVKDPRAGKNQIPHAEAQHRYCFPLMTATG